MPDPNPPTTLRRDRLEAVLRTACSPPSLTIEDESALHAGHAGASHAGETHYRVTMTAAAFSGQTRVERSRSVHALLATEFQAGLHALSLQLLAPDDTPAALQSSKK